MPGSIIGELLVIGTVRRQMADSVQQPSRSHSATPSCDVRACHAVVKRRLVQECSSIRVRMTRSSLTQQSFIHDKLANIPHPHPCRFRRALGSLLAARRSAFRRRAGCLLLQLLCTSPLRVAPARCRLEFFCHLEGYCVRGSM